MIPAASAAPSTIAATMIAAIVQAARRDGAR